MKVSAVKRMAFWPSAESLLKDPFGKPSCTIDTMAVRSLV